MKSSAFSCSPERVIFNQKIGSVFIEDCRMSVKPDSGDPSALKIEAVIGVGNREPVLIEAESLRLWIEGENSLGEPLQIVLVEHLYLPDESYKKVTLSGSLFNPVFSPKEYKCTLEYLDYDDRTLWVSKFEMTVIPRNEN